MGKISTATARVETSIKIYVLDKFQSHQKWKTSGMIAALLPTTFSTTKSLFQEFSRLSHFTAARWIRCEHSGASIQHVPDSFLTKFVTILFVFISVICWIFRWWPIYWYGAHPSVSNVNIIRCRHFCACWFIPTQRAHIGTLTKQHKSGEVQNKKLNTRNYMSPINLIHMSYGIRHIYVLDYDDRYTRSVFCAQPQHCSLRGRVRSTQNKDLHRWYYDLYNVLPRFILPEKKYGKRERER